jgi:hypothetical protein
LGIKVIVIDKYVSVQSARFRFMVHNEEENNSDGRTLQAASGWGMMMMWYKE